MSPESKFYARIKRALKSFPVILERLENSTGVGTPDVYFTTSTKEGFAELKYSTSYPKRIETKIRVPFRPGQYAWFRRRNTLNPDAGYFLIFGICRDVYVFSGENVQEAYTMEDLTRMSCTVILEGQKLGLPLFGAFS